MPGIQIPATVFFDMLMRQRAEENFKESLKDLIDIGYDPADIHDQLTTALDTIATEYEMEYPMIEVGNIVFYGGDDDPKFPFEKG